MFEILYKLQIGDIVRLKFDAWDNYKVVIEDEEIKLQSIADKMTYAGYECNDMTDLVVTMLNDLNENILQDVRKG